MKKIALSLLMIPSQIWAAGVSPARCESQIVNSNQADVRNEWGDRCLPATHLKDAHVVAKAILKAVNENVGGKKFYYTVNDTNGVGYERIPWKESDSGAACFSVPEKYNRVDICQSGCFSADQKILVSSGYEKVENLKDKDVALATLAPDSTFENTSFRLFPDTYMVESLNKEEINEIITFFTDFGTLKVTTGHRLLDGEGMVKEAVDFQVGDSLVRANGELAKITAIDSKEEVGRVYHVSAESLDPKDNIIVAQGFLSGSHRMQIGLIDVANRILMRGRL